jgi:hypothetical protein
VSDISCHDHGNCELCDKLEADRDKLAQGVERLKAELALYVEGEGCKWHGVAKRAEKDAKFYQEQYNTVVFENNLLKKQARELAEALRKIYENGKGIDEMTEWAGQALAAYQSREK